MLRLYSMVYSWSRPKQQFSLGKKHKQLFNAACQTVTLSDNIMHRHLSKATVGLHCAVISFCLFACVAGVCNVAHCSNPSTCILSFDGQSCKCAPRYYGDLCEKVASVQLLCGMDYITIAINEDFFKYYNVPVESLHLANKSCRAHKEDISGVQYYMVQTTKEKYAACGGKPLEKNITHIAYSLTLMSEPNVHENIIRDPTVKIDYTCVYPYMRTISLPFPVIPFASETIMRIDDLDAKVEMSLFKDHTYTDAFSSAPMLQLRDRVYVQVSVTEPRDFFLLSVQECWASQSAEHNDTSALTYTLLSNGCVKDDTVVFEDDALSDSTLNGQGSTVRYSFSMFRFVAQPSVLYLHCRVNLCTNEDAEPCRPTCKSIVKRAAERVDSEEGNQGLLSYGPIKVHTAEAPTSKLVLMLMLPVGAVWLLGLVLLILTTYAKTRARGSPSTL
ncbi:zona pellucida glycoprotein d [Engraulis encrasicolus]|uniref:zona pellucida glycoprotein d n=1 Tax=Engraulis encrasicolus TaxID=184585 RepID=UPI002FD6518B